jgi:hypothetical protein
MNTDRPPEQFSLMTRAEPPLSAGRAKIPVESVWIDHERLVFAAEGRVMLWQHRRSSVERREARARNAAGGHTPLLLVEVGPARAERLECVNVASGRRLDRRLA